MSAWRLIGTAVLTAACLLVVWWRPAPVPVAHAQGVGIFVRASCTSINGPVVGSTQCWDSTFNQLRSWSGVSWIAVGAQPVPAGAGTIATLTLDPNGRMTVPSSVIIGGGIAVGATPPTDQGAGTLNWASAAYANSRPVIVATGSGANLTSALGISASSSLSNNLRGTCTFAAASTCVVSFASNEPNAHYFVALSCAGTHPVGLSGKSSAGFTLTATVSNSNACDYILIR